MPTARFVRSGRGLTLAAFLLLAACSSAPAPAPAPSPLARSTTPTAEPCAAPEASQFDFYVGTWNMSWKEFSPTPLSGRDVIVKNGCQLDEVLTAPLFLGTTNYRATSVTAWQPARGKWVQDYRDNQGQRSYVGSFQDGQMVLVGSSSIKQRLTWRDITANAFVWVFETSPDGSTWNEQAVIDYTRA